MQQAQNTTSEAGEVPLKNVSELLGKHYYIPNYQRGYRWGKDEVSKLLDDIWDFASHRKSEFYCLQPLIILPHKLSDAKNLQPPIILPQEPSDAEETALYEVLDGQQRLTTLNLIVHYVNEHFRERASIQRCTYTIRPALRVVRLFPLFILVRMVG